MNQFIGKYKKLHRKFSGFFVPKARWSSVLIRAHSAAVLKKKDILGSRLSCIKVSIFLIKSRLYGKAFCRGINHVEELEISNEKTGCGCFRQPVLHDLFLLALNDRLQLDPQVCQQVVHCQLSLALAFIKGMLKHIGKAG